MNDLANVKKNAMARNLSVGENVRKEEVLKAIPERFANLHRDEYIHIHDLEFYDQTHNCLGTSVTDLVKDTDLQVTDALREAFRGIIALTNDQSGGIGFLSFDTDMAKFRMDESDEVLTKAFRDFFKDLNIHTRKGCEMPYTTLNVGLGTSEKARRITKAILDAAFMGDSKGSPFLFPNIVFKYSRKVNGEEGTPNYDLYLEALKGTAHKMVPTYFNCDAPFNKSADANSIGIMGCRTRVVADIYGKATGLNRGNIACVTINLVKLAVESNHDFKIFQEKICSLFDECRELLIHRYNTLLNQANPIFALDEGLYQDAIQGREAAFKHGTLSIGFIGLWDALSEIFNLDFTDTDNLQEYQAQAIETIRLMRKKVDSYIERDKLNFSLLASAAEGTTGKFAMHDHKIYGENCKAAQKEFYTNSFHVPVNAEMHYMTKIELEAPFHAICNGGCITYVELSEPIFHNRDAAQEIVEFAMKNNCNYFGINFPLDICNECGHKGRIGQCCSSCGSTNIKRLRRVSGYLSEENSFTVGKKKELAMRKASF